MTLSLSNRWVKDLAGRVTRDDNAPHWCAGWTTVAGLPSVAKRSPGSRLRRTAFAGRSSRKVAARKRVSRAGLQVLLEPNRHLLGSELDAHVDDPRRPSRRRSILAGIVSCQPSRHVTGRSDISLVRIGQASEDVDESPWCRTHTGVVCKRCTGTSATDFTRALPRSVQRRIVGPEGQIADSDSPPSPNARCARGFGGQPSPDAHPARWPASRSQRAQRAVLAKAGGEGGIRTPVPVTRQDAFEAPPLRPLRYLSVYYSAPGPVGPLAARSRFASGELPSNLRG